MSLIGKNETSKVMLFTFTTSLCWLPSACCEDGCCEDCKGLIHNKKYKRAHQDSGHLL